MTEDVERYFAELQAVFSSLVRGDFAAGQRDMESGEATIGSFATGQRQLFVEAIYEIY
jgi:hypothetical protein